MSGKSNKRRPKRVNRDADRKAIVVRNLSVGALAVMIGGFIGWNMAGRSHKCLR